MSFRLQSGEVYQLLNDFSLVISSIRYSSFVLVCFVTGRVVSCRVVLSLFETRQTQQCHCKSRVIVEEKWLAALPFPFVVAVVVVVVCLFVCLFLFFCRLSTQGGSGCQIICRMSCVYNDLNQISKHGQNVNLKTQAFSRVHKQNNK